MVGTGISPNNICNGCGMPTEDAYSSGHLVLSHFGTCMCSNVETNLSWTCLVSGPLNFEHPSVLLFCLELWEQISFFRVLYFCQICSLIHIELKAQYPEIYIITNRIYSTSNFNFDNSILFYLANFLFYSILFCIFYSIFLYNSPLCSILFSILQCILFYSILLAILFYSILFSILSILSWKIPNFVNISSYIITLNLLKTYMNIIN